MFNQVGDQIKVAAIYRDTDRASGEWSVTEPGMSLNTILAAKGGDVICIEPTADLAAAAKLLSTHRIGVLVVLDGGRRLVGILSERDIVRAVADGGSTILQLPVAQVMTRNVSTCDVNEFDRQRHGPHDEGQIPPYAGA